MVAKYVERLLRPRSRARRELSDHAVRRRSRSRSPPSAAARSSSSSTTRTARTRATSSWRPRSPRPRRSPSSSATRRGVICMPIDRRAARRARPPADGRATTPRRSAPRSPSRSTAAHGTTHRHLGRRPVPPPSRPLIDPATRPDDLARPGHIFPLRYREGGVLKRAGHTEAAVDLARMAGLYPAGVLVRDRQRRRHDGPAARPRARSPTSTACC